MSTRNIVGWTSAVALAVVAQFGAGCGSTVTMHDNTGGSGPSGSGASTQASSGSSSASGGGSDLASCTGPEQCTLVAKTCCGVCGTPQLGDVTAIHQDKTGMHQQQVCGDEPPPCPSCASMPNPNLVAFCGRPSVADPNAPGTCQAMDIRKEPITACNSDDDCRLRMGAGCCEACIGDDHDLIAIAKTGEGKLKGLVCGPALGCPECSPSYPNDVYAACVQGHCAVQVLDVDG